ncbi:BON domain-containing protein [Pelagibius sp. CAU 1746]|uniref:BON domain-containing protein n=1 Tax=Pelagibius sp. CAU 1746 TaxID=3140370 RepID=UPI00325B94CB
MPRSLLFASSIALSLTMIAPGCSSSPKQESTGEYIDSSAVTAEVKADLLAAPGLKSMQISVETYKGVVQLSGFVDSYDAKRHAGSIAMAVDGVKSVRNDLVVR